MTRERRQWIVAVFLLAVGCLGVPAVADDRSGERELGNRLVLEDFRAKDADGFPQGWKAHRSEAKARQAYRVQSEQGTAFLTASAHYS